MCAFSALWIVMPCAKAPGHLFTQCCWNINCIGLFWYQNITFIVSNSRKYNYILIKLTHSFKGEVGFCDLTSSWGEIWHANLIYCQISNIRLQIQKIKCFSSCLYAIYCSQVLSQNWRCSWSSTDRWCFNYILSMLSDQQFYCPLSCTIY